MPSVDTVQISPASPDWTEQNATRVPSGDTCGLPSNNDERATAGIIGAVCDARHTVPFKGSLEGTVTSTPLEPPFTLTEISAHGRATQLGAFTVEMPHTVNLVTRTGEGSMTFTAANGDTLTAHFTGQAQGFPILTIVEHATITRGTGRFAGATGSFTGERLFDTIHLTTTGTFEGTITTPGTR